MCLGKTDQGGPCRCGNDAYSNAEAASARLEATKKQLSDAEERLVAAERMMLDLEQRYDEDTLATAGEGLSGVERGALADDLRNANREVQYAQSDFSSAAEDAEGLASELAVSTACRQDAPPAFRRALDDFEAACEAEPWDEAAIRTAARAVVDTAPNAATRRGRQAADERDGIILMEKMTRAQSAQRALEQAVGDRSGVSDAAAAADRATADYDAALASASDGAVMQAILHRGRAGAARAADNPKLEELNGQRDTWNTLTADHMTPSTETLANMGVNFWTTAHEAGELPAGRSEQMREQVEQNYGRLARHRMSTQTAERAAVAKASRAENAWKQYRDAERAYASAAEGSSEALLVHDLRRNAISLQSESDAAKGKLDRAQRRLRRSYAGVAEDLQVPRDVVRRALAREEDPDRQPAEV